MINEDRKAVGSHSNEDIVGGDDEESERCEMLSMVLNLLSAILGLGSRDRSVEEENMIRDLLEPVQLIALNEQGRNAVAQDAFDVAVMLLLRQSSLGSSAHVATSSFDEPSTLMSVRESVTASLTNEYLFSTCPAMRALGIRNILQALRNQREVILQQPEISILPTVVSQALSELDADLVLRTLMTKVDDDDSFVYLNSLQAISILANRIAVSCYATSGRAKIFDILLEAFLGEAISSSSAASPSRPPQSTQCASPPLRKRAMIGEALGLLLRSAGAAAPPLLPSLMAVCVRVARVRASVEEESLIEKYADLGQMRLRRQEPTDSGSDSGDGLPMADNERQAVDEICVDEDAKLIRRKVTIQGAVVASVDVEHRAGSEAADRALLRQSAVSLLADAVAAGGWGAAQYLTDALDVSVDQFFKLLQQST